SGKGEPGIRIYLYEGDTRLATTLVDANGNWTISDQVFLSPGNHVFTLTDNNGERSEPFVLNVIEATSGKPVIESAVDNIGADIGLIGNGAITDDARPTLLGRGEPNTTVSLYVDGRYMVSAVVDEDGSWSLLSPRALAPGEHVFTVGGDGVMSDPFVLTVINAPQAATLVIESAFDQTGPMTGMIADGSATDEHRPVFHGRGEPDAPVFLFVSTGGNRLLVGSGVVQSDGTWEVGIDSNRSLASGHNVFTVSDGVSDSVPFTLHIGIDESILMTAVQDDTTSDVMPLALSLSDLLQDASGELFADEMTLPSINDIHPELDLSVVVETEGGINTWVAIPSLPLEQELTHAA
ncbi:Ig-like domain-containing protein, partial [Pseudomonas fluorescens]|uniref:Ig-like domain-containing protein n=1 Tax=Pseudomonas fluorescens TaxID=294 RepID=UPI001C160A9A